MKKLYPIIIVVVAAALILSACGGGAAPAPSGGAKPAPTEAAKQPASKPTAKPTDKPAEQPAQPPVATPEGGTSKNSTDAIDLKDVTSGLESLNSYQSTFTMSFEGKDDNGQPTSSSMSFTEDFVKNPPAKRTTINGFGAMLSGTPEAKPQDNAMQTIEVGGKQYFRMGTMCTQSTSKDAPQAQATFNPSDVMGGIHGAQLIGTETVNGVPTAHYKSDVKGLETLGYLDAQGEFWIAQPGDFVVKYTFTATGKNQFMGSSKNEGTVKWVYEVKQINQPIDIQAPKDCAGAAEDIPMMADAADQSAMGGITMYTTPSKFADVVAFYEKEMRAQGWQAKEDGGMSAEGVSMKSYTKDNRTVQVTITSDSGGKTSVMITEEKK